MKYGNCLEHVLAEVASEAKIVSLQPLKARSASQRYK